VRDHLIVGEGGRQLGEVDLRVVGHVAQRPFP
jgi:hypothetical protein